jgi:hypothetical protein
MWTVEFIKNLPFTANIRAVFVSVEHKILIELVDCIICQVRKCVILQKHI